MELSEIQKEKIALENEIAQKLLSFSAKTGCPVESIHIQRMDVTRHDGNGLRAEYGYPPCQIRVTIP